MDQTTTTNSADAWAMATLGASIGVLVDRTLNNPQVIQSSQQYGVDAYGNLYPLGQPASAQNVAPPSGNGGGSGLLLLIGLVLLVSHHG